VISVSIPLSEIMQSKFSVSENNIYVLPNGILKDKFFPINRNDAIKNIAVNDKYKKNIVFAGNLKEIKNISLLVKAFHKLYLDDQTVALHILGDGVMRNEIESYIKNNNLEKNIVLYGRVLHEKIPAWMSYADVFVLPSKKEGMPNVVLEALSCGTPVVASDIDATRGLIDAGVNGYLFDLNDLDDFVEKLRHGLELKKSSRFDHKHEMIISWQDNAAKLYGIIS
jgi:glycosyltransferase involved in cell wall biosynthesis